MKVQETQDASISIGGDVHQGKREATVQANRGAKGSDRDCVCLVDRSPIHTRGLPSLRTLTSWFFGIRRSELAGSWAGVLQLPWTYRVAAEIAIKVSFMSV